VLEPELATRPTPGAASSGSPPTALRATGAAADSALARADPRRRSPRAGERLES
jgi:hypothetical protein